MAERIVFLGSALAHLSTNQRSAYAKLCVVGFQENGTGARVCKPNTRLHGVYIHMETDKTAVS